MNRLGHAVGLCALFVANAAAADEAKPAATTTTPVEDYRAMSGGLVSGFDLMLPLGAPSGWTGLATQFGATKAAGIVGFNVAGRFVIQGLVIGAQVGFSFFDGLISNTIVIPGVSVGYAIPLTGQLALTPAFRTVFLIPTAPNSSADLQITGEVGLEYFFGKHGYMEPVIAMGDYQVTNLGTSGQATFIFGVGYRLGVVF
jgi:hypothetical protein